MMADKPPSPGQETLCGLYDAAVMRLREARKPVPDHDAGILLEHVTGHGALTRLTAPHTPVNAARAALFESLIDRRISGEPVHRITGAREFYGMALSLNEATLIPRPDTEALVDLAVPFARAMVEKTGTCRILDLGTGSGAIALALLGEISGAVATATDIEPRALAATTANGEALGLDDRLTVLESDWFSALSGRFDLIVSNPPYIARHELARLDAEVREHDPLLALDGGIDGMNAYAVIAARAEPFLAREGAICLEIGQGQAPAVIGYFETAGFIHRQTRADLAGIDRALAFTRSKE
jgi:release factor glutamine methyltransferase